MTNQSNPISELKITETLTENLRHLMQIAKIKEAELARQTNIPQPTLHKILSGKTIDPRASTLKSLADYFGISIDNLLIGSSVVTPSNMPIDNTFLTPILSWGDCLYAYNSIKKLAPSSEDAWTALKSLPVNSFALKSKPSMEPRFPKGTILIIAPEIKAEDGDIVLVHYLNTEEATLRMLSTDGPVRFLLPICANAKPDQLTDEIKILGVLINSYFTHKTL